MTAAPPLHRPLTALLLALLPGLLAAPAVAQDADDLALRDGEVHLFMRTEAGDIHLAVDTLRAPITAGNFLRYVDAGMYVGGTFYRAVRMDNQPDDRVKIEVIQGGIDRARREEVFEPIPLEGTDETGILHTDGVISMARGGPNTARGEFFITIEEQPSLDRGGDRNPDGYGFAAFGRVLRGMDVVREIQSRPTDGQYLTTRVGIVFLERVGMRHEAP
jgi:peptidyl-prolyl cis-trans isomerase A (cyclophilin A)